MEWLHNLQPIVSDFLSLTERTKDTKQKRAEPNA